MKKCLKRTKNTKNHKHAKNHNHMTCRSSDRVQTSFLPILGHFCFFTPFLTQKIKLFEKWKKKKPRKKTHKKNKKNPARDTVDSLYLELLSISNKKLCPLDICVLSKVFFISLSRTSISQFFSLSRTKILVPCDYFYLYLEIFPV